MPKTETLISSTIFKRLTCLIDAIKKLPAMAPKPIKLLV